MKEGTIIKDRVDETVLSLSTLGLTVVMPQVFHYFGLGREFLPMYFPLLAAAFFASGRLTGLVPAVLAPVLSCLLFGMPALPVAAAVVPELVVLFLTVQFIVRKKWNAVILLPFVLAFGRAVSLLGQLALNGGRWDTAWAFTSSAYPGLIALFVVGVILQAVRGRNRVNEE